jgi:hypothetical protein
MKTVANSLGSSTQGRNQPGKGDASVPVNDICQKLLDLLTSAVSNSPDRQEGQVKGSGDIGNCGRFQVHYRLGQAEYLRWQRGFGCQAGSGYQCSGDTVRPRP